MNAVNVYRREWESEWLSGDSVRACAGGVSGDDVHSATVQLLVRHNGEIAPNAQVTFAYEDNVGHDYGDGRAIKRAKLWEPETSLWMESVTLTTDAEGKVSCKVLSSDVISQPKLVVKHDNAVFGSVDCDFAAAVGKRGWPNQYDPTDTTDDGWLFNQRWFDTPGEQTTAKLYLQFKSILNGPDDDSNWKRVNGHNVMFTVDHVDLTAEAGGGQGSPVQDYAFIVNNNDPEAYAVIAQSRNDGSVNGTATATLKAGNKIADATQIWLHGYDVTQWEN